MKRRSCPPCTGDCHSGRECLDSTNATRAAFGLPPLHESDGGHTVSGPIVFPLHVDREEEMPAQFRTPPRAVLRAVLIARIAVVLVIVALAALVQQNF